MSDDTSTSLKGWSSVQVYTLSAICLLIGITMGYLVRGSTAAPAAPMAAVQTSSNSLAGALPPGASQPTPQDMKRMAEKQVAPLLEQLKSSPNDPELLRKVAHFYMVAGQHDDAAVYYEREVAVRPSADGYTQLGIAQYYSGVNDKAIESLNKALKLDPNNANALYNLGMLKWEAQGDAKGAIAEWEQLVKTNPKHPQIEAVKKMIAKAKQHENLPPGTKTDKPAM